MDEAILALQLAVRDAERVVSAQWDEVQNLEKEIAELQHHLGAAYERYENSAEWLEGLEHGLHALEDLNVKATN